MKFDFDSTTPGISTLSGGSFTISNRAHSWPWRGFAASKEMPLARTAKAMSIISASGTSQCGGPHNCPSFYVRQLAGAGC